MALGQRLEREGFAVSNLWRSEEFNGDLFHLVELTSVARKVSSCWVPQTCLGQMRSGRTFLSKLRASEKLEGVSEQPPMKVPMIVRNNHTIANTCNNNSTNNNICSNTNSNNTSNISLDQSIPEPTESNIHHSSHSIQTTTQNNYNNDNTSSTSSTSRMSWVPHGRASNITSTTTTPRIRASEVTHPTTRASSDRPGLMDRLVAEIESTKAPKPSAVRTDTTTMPRYLVRHSPYYL